MPAIIHYYAGLIAHIELNKADKHNALSPEDIKQFDNVLTEIEQREELRIVIITGRGEKTFCAGATLEQLDDNSLRGDAFSGLAQRLVGLSLPSICLLNGSVYGGGVELALACDFRIGLSSSRLKVPVAKLGLCYGEFGLRLYHATLGLTLSKRILCSAETLTAQQLLELGFYIAIFSDYAQAREHTLAMAQRISELAPLAVTSMRHSLNDIALQQLDSARASQREQLCLNSADKHIGFSAARNNAQPQFNNH